jgi:integrase
MNERKDYSLYKRSIKGQQIKGARWIWYYRTYDEYGRRTSGRSTGETNKTRAERYCNGLIRVGKLIPTKKTLFRDYSVDWWIWDRCSYIKGKLARSSPTKPSISRRHADDMRRILEDHILPTFREYQIDSITPQAIEKWMFDLRDRGLSGKRVNNIVSCFRVMLREAKRLGLLPRDPFDVVRPLSDNPRERGILTIAEVQNLFLDENIESFWGGHLLYRCVNLVAAGGGLRQGEILGIRDADVKTGYLHVAHSWNPKYGLGPTKTREVREVPLPDKVMKAVLEFVGTGGYVFSLTNGARPVTGNRVTEHFYRTLERSGISPEERKQRNITFHSWRHFFNSIMRTREVPTAILQRVTGHSTVQMIERYSHFSLEDFKPITIVQSEVFS